MKKVMASVLALTMAVSLAACGSSPEKTQEPKSEAASTSGQGQQDTANQRWRCGNMRGLRMILSWNISGWEAR